MRCTSLRAKSSEPSSPFQVSVKMLGAGRCYLKAAASLFLIIPQGEAQLFNYTSALGGFGGGNLPTAQARSLPDSPRCMLRLFILHSCTWFLLQDIRASLVVESHSLLLPGGMCEGDLPDVMQTNSSIPLLQQNRQMPADLGTIFYNSIANNQSTAVAGDASQTPASASNSVKHSATSEAEDTLMSCLPTWIQSMRGCSCCRADPLH